MFLIPKYSDILLRLYLSSQQQFSAALENVHVDSRAISDYQ